jgi:ribosomal protein L16/L10AE
MRFHVKNQETTSFKKRYDVGYKLPKLVFGDFSFTLLKSYNIEYIYLYNFKKSLKKYYGFKKSIDKKVWLFLHKNYPLTKKSKNARMGKGKGALTRYCSRTLKNHNIFEFRGFNLKELFFLKKIFNKKINIPLKIQSDFFLRKSYKYTYNSIENFFFNRKYGN